MVQVSIFKKVINFIRVAAILILMLAIVNNVSAGYGHRHHVQPKPTPTPTPTVLTPAPVIYDDFNSTLTYTLNDGDTSPDGKWLCLWNGYGSSGTITDSGRNAFFMYPQTSTDISQTASNLVISTQKFSDFGFTIDAKTVQQLRKNNPPNEWEAAWVMFRYTDTSHYYYFTVKTNGIELGKYDGGSQIYLYTANSPNLTIGQWSTWKINVVGNHIIIYVDGVKAVDYIDRTMSNQLKSGSIGMYDEDAYVMFDNILKN